MIADRLGWPVCLLRRFMPVSELFEWMAFFGMRRQEDKREAARKLSERLKAAFATHFDRAEK
jgi:hypothetical protein